MHDVKASWPGFSARGTLVLPLPDAPPAAPVDIEGLRFEPKRELHVTLIGHALGADLRAALRTRCDARVRALFASLDWRHRRLGAFHLIEKHARRDDGRMGRVASVVELIEMPAMAGFHGALGALLGRELPSPPPHVTLYVHGKASGIGVPTPRALRQWGRPLDPACLG